MAEFMFKNLVEKKGHADDFIISSTATSYEEIGNPVYPPARKMLAYHGISCEGKTASHFEKKDYEDNDYILCMDSYNLKSLRNMTAATLMVRYQRCLTIPNAAEIYPIPGIQEILNVHMKTLKKDLKHFII